MPNNIFDNNHKPKACGIVIVGNPNINGINQFHNNHIGIDSNNANNNITAIADNVKNTGFIILSIYF